MFLNFWCNSNIKFGWFLYLKLFQFEMITNKQTKTNKQIKKGKICGKCMRISQFPLLSIQIFSERWLLWFKLFWEHACRECRRERSSYEISRNIGNHLHNTLQAYAISSKPSQVSVNMSAFKRLFIYFWNSHKNMRCCF